MIFILFDLVDLVWPSQSGMRIFDLNGAGSEGLPAALIEKIL